jgi:hypothetical protein
MTRKHEPAMRTEESYSRLDADQVVATVTRLRQRIGERFPASGLLGVATQLLAVATEAKARSEWIRRPHLGLRLLALSLVAGFFGVVLFAGFGYLRDQVDWVPRTGPELVGEVNDALSTLIFLAAAIVYVFSLETRAKRRKALAAVHELRALAHIVDMHQLTKDPDRVAQQGQDTASSPKRVLSRFELGRYLDYCSELLALISKVGALYVQGFEDDVLVSAIDEIEDLTTGLSRKIWQKIELLDRAT